MAKISFIGAGYVGLVSGTIFAHLGHDVKCVDLDENKVSKLQKGQIPIYEPQLQSYLNESIASGKLSFSNKIESDTEIDAVFIAVGTPPKEDGQADLSYINQAILDCADAYSPDSLIIIKSTIPPQTCQNIQLMLRQKGFKHEIASNPEFLREGSAVTDFLEPDRIICGISSDKAKKVFEKIYLPLTKKGYPIIFTDTNTSELTKYASNSFLATKVAFINEMANLCETLGANIDKLTYGMGKDKRIGEAFLKVGPGFGGSCFPKDLLAISHLSKEKQELNTILEAVIDANEARSLKLVNKIKNVLSTLKNKRIAIFGTTFKAETDDVRSSPAIKICKLLLDNGADLHIFDPAGMDNTAKEISASFHQNPYDAAMQADCIVILTEWKIFAQLDYNKIKNNMRKACLFDFRNLLDQDLIKEIDFDYHCLGKKGHN